MADIENANAVVAAAAAEPSRHGFRAWYERFLLYDGSPRNGADTEVARAEPVQRSRRIYLCFSGVIIFLVLAISVFLLVIEDQWPMARPLRVAANVVGWIGMVIGCFLLSFVIYLALACLEEFQKLQRILDLLL
jgi:hypothetical protein